MKNSILAHALALAGVTALSLAFAPLAGAEPNASQPTNAPTDSKVDGSMAGNSANAPAPSNSGSLDKTNSKDLNNSLDKNPSTEPTGSAASSSTKSPSDATTSGQKTERTASSSNERSPKMSDKEFLETAAQGGMTEVELGKLAQEKAASSDVKQFGSRMVTDHSKADADLKTVADKNGVTVPTTLDAKHQAMVDKFQHLSGQAFDKAYVKMMVHDHEKDASEFRSASTNAQDPDVRTFASNTLTVIESHLSAIKSIESTQK